MNFPFFDWTRYITSNDILKEERETKLRLIRNVQCTCTCVHDMYMYMYHNFLEFPTCTLLDLEGV